MAVCKDLSDSDVDEKVQIQSFRLWWQGYFRNPYYEARIWQSQKDRMIPEHLHSVPPIRGRESKVPLPFWYDGINEGPSPGTIDLLG